MPSVAVSKDEQPRCHLEAAADSGALVYGQFPSLLQWHYRWMRTGIIGGCTDYVEMVPRRWYQTNLMPC